MQDTSNEPLTQAPDPRPVQTSEQLVKDWQPAVGLDDVVLLEDLLDDALKHLSKVLALLPSDSHKAASARTFLAQFRQP